MHSKYGTLSALALTLASLLATPCASAWSNGGYSADIEDPDYGTHDWIADMALELQTEDVSFLETTYHVEYLLGTEAPDNPDFIGDSVNHHVYYWSSGGLQDDICAERAAAMYDLALLRLDAGDFSVAAYYMGAMAHYVSDVGVFGHTMRAYTDWGTEVHHSDYESEFEDFLYTLESPTGLTLGDEDAYGATLALARDITFGSGDIKTNVWMDDNYDWSDDDCRESALASLHASVSAVASAINHLMVETSDEPAPDPDEPEPDEPEPVEPPTVPTPPRSLEVYIDEGAVLIMWLPPSSDGGAYVIDYTVFRSQGTGAVKELATVPITTLSWTDSSVEEGGTYNYSVRARNSVGLSEPSDVVAVTVPNEEEDSPSTHVVVAAIAAAIAAGGAITWNMARRRGGR